MTTPAPVEAGLAILDAPLEGALDFDGLRREGLERLAELAGRVWTDFNAHDPGVTMLEAMVWAINELAYRAQFPIADLLARKSPSDQKAQTPTFTAREILTQGRSPVTVLDWRKLVIDEPGVRNAWLQPAARPNQPIYVDRFEKKLAYDPPATEPSTPAIAVRGVHTFTLQLEEHETLGELDRTKALWTPIPPDEDPLPLELVFPRWDAWRAAGARWDDRWVHGSVVSIAVLSKTVPAPEQLTAELRVDVLPEGGGAVVSRTLELKAALLTGLRGSISDRLDFIEAELLRVEETNPVVQYHARLAAAFEIASRVASTITARRNLCEDFTDPAAARFEDVAVCAELEVPPDADLDETAARLLLVFEGVLGAPPRFRTLGELVELGLRTEEIFSGPALRHGFLLDEELDRTAPGREVHGSDLIAAALDSGLVLTVRSLTMGSYDDEGNERYSGERWRLRVGADRIARLDPERSKLVLHKNGIPFAPDRARMRELLRELRVEARQSREELEAAPRDFPIPEGRWRQLDQYVPLRFELPRVYGVGADGLPGEAGPVRRTQARQLQQFLLLFDHLLASGVEQVANLDRLLSIEEGETRTLFSADLRALDPDPDHPLHKPSAPDGDPHEESAADFHRRRNAFLNHLLARFDDPFAESAAWIAADRRRRAGGGANDAIDRQQIESKAAWLRALPTLSAERGRAFDLAEATEAWPNDALTGLERRVCQLLGIRRQRRDSLVDRFTFTEGVGPDGEEFSFRMNDSSGTAVLESSGAYPDPSAATFAAAATERAATLDERYAIVTVEGQLHFAVCDAGGDVLALSVATFGSDEDASAAARAFAEEIRAAPDTEGMHLIEHVLLRPQARDEALLDVSIDPSCPVQPQQADPYSLRATVVLPAWTGRFDDPAFRAFAERTLRAEAPAHVFLKICWVDALALKRVEEKWRSWLEVCAADLPDPADRAARLADLTDALSKLRNVHPIATLHDCKEDEGDNPLVLGRNQLGTMKPRGA